MCTKETLRIFLESLQWERFTKAELRFTMEQHLGVPITFENGTVEDCKAIDYSILATTATEDNCTHNFVDMEIWYLKTRDRKMLITGTKILDWVD